MMSLKKLFRKFSYWRLSRGWRMLTFCRLQIDFREFKVNDLPFGSTPVEASSFGRPQRITAVDEDVFQFEFRSNGLLLEYEKGLLSYIGVIFDYSQEAQHTYADRAAEMCALYLHDGLTKLDHSVTLSQVRGALGTAVQEEQDEDQSLLVYHLKGHVLEFEFLPDGKLARFNLFPQ